MIMFTVIVIEKKATANSQNINHYNLEVILSFGMSL